MRNVTTRLAGLIILIAGIWGGLIPFVGPYFHFTLGPDSSWTWTSTRLYLSVLPAIAAIVGGLLLLGVGSSALGRAGALLALVGGTWFAIGPTVSLLWHTGGAEGVPHGRTFTRMLEYVTLHTGLGVLIVGLAAFALPTAVVMTRRRTETTAPATRAAPAATGTTADGQTADEQTAAPTRTREPVAGEEREPVASEERQPAAGEAAPRELVR
jgi:hypothetical protein